MIRCIYCLIVVLAAYGSLSAHTPRLTWSTMQTYSYEDLSDFVRRYAGMYPLDYGTMGAPLYFRPWNLEPWNVQVELNGHLQNRRYDGLYDVNLQPVIELESIGIAYAGGSPTGTIKLESRNLHSDVANTELQIREGFYKHGSVEFAHGQPIYKTADLELTGRLLWYDGLRLGTTASRLGRVRAKAGADLSSEWRAEVTYSGSNDEADFPLNSHGIETEREEALLVVAPRDSIQMKLAPRVRLFVRKDREHWGSTFKTRELQYGWTAEIGRSFGIQRVTLTQSTALSDIEFPGMENHKDVLLWASLRDSIQLQRLIVSGAARLKREDPRSWRDSKQLALGSDGNLRVTYKASSAVQSRIGVSYCESVPAPAWWNGQYRISDRPHIFSREFSDINRVYAPDEQAANQSGADRFLTTLAGGTIQSRIGEFDLNFQMLDRRGEFANHFTVVNDTVKLVYDKAGDMSDKTGFSCSGTLPLRWGLRLESQWFVELDPNEVMRAVQTRAYSRLYFERQFFTAPLIVRSHISHEQIGAHEGFSSNGTQILQTEHIIGFRVSSTIHGVTLFWGTENFFGREYEYMPGFPLIGKEEYLGVNWKLWL